VRKFAGMSTWTTPERPEPPTNPIDERAALEDRLEYHRTTLLLKCGGLTTEQLALRSVPPSELSLLGLVRHRRKRIGFDTLQAFRPSTARQMRRTDSFTLRTMVSTTTRSRSHASYSRFVICSHAGLVSPAMSSTRCSARRRCSC